MCFFFTLTARESFSSSRVSEVTKTFEQMKSVVTEGGGRPFITKWQGRKGEVLEIPIVGQYQLVIKDESGQGVINEEVKIADEEHPYLFTPPADGLYTVETGPEGVEYMRLREYKDCEDEDCEDEEQTYKYRYETLLEVVQFGTVEWRSMHAMFRGCERMTFAPGIDMPDLRQVTDMGWMFAGCSAFNQPLEKWDVGQVINMHGMFAGCSAFNQPLEKWDVGQVTDMRVMFAGCRFFNQPLGKWDVGQVIDMGWMFAGCSVFNQPLEKWDVGQVTDMREMFAGCSAFNQPLEGWDVSQVEFMNEMFSGCIAFNQPLEKWDVGKVTNMSGMFCRCIAFNQPLEAWNVANVRKMGFMFSGCSVFNQSLGAWNISKLCKDKAKDIFTNCPAGALPFAQEWREKGDVLSDEQ